jgi:hypothetical protein
MRLANTAIEAIPADRTTFSDVRFVVYVARLMLAVNGCPVPTESGRQLLFSV